MHLCRSEADIPAASELHAIAQQGMTLTLILSQPDNHWQGLQGRLNDEHLQLIKGLAEKEVFICGPHGFMADAAAKVAALGVPAARIKQESFGGAILSVARPIRRYNCVSAPKPLPATIRAQCWIRPTSKA